MKYKAKKIKVPRSKLRGIVGTCERVSNVMNKHFVRIFFIKEMNRAASLRFVKWQCDFMHRQIRFYFLIHNFFTFLFFLISLVARKRKIKPQPFRRNVASLLPNLAPQHTPQRLMQQVRARVILHGHLARIGKTSLEFSQSPSTRNFLMFLKFSLKSS